MKSAKRFSLLVVLLAAQSVARADVALPQNFNFDGVLQDNNGVPIVSVQTVDFKIYDPSGSSCLLYEETQTVAPDAQGNFSVQVGAGTRAGQDPGLAWPTVLQNNSQVRTPGTGCSPGYTPSAGDERKIVVTVGSTVLSPDFSLTTVPMATVAQTLQGLPSTQFLQVGGTGTPNLTQGNLAALFTGTAYTNLENVLSGGAVSVATNGGAQLPVYTTAPSTPAAGNIWYNQTTGAVNFFNGSSNVALSAGGGVTSVTAGAGLNGGTITSSGSISLSATGTAGTYTKVTTDAYGRVTTGTTITGSDITPGGTISGTTMINVSSPITTTGALTGGTLSVNSATTNSVALYSSGNYVTMTAPAGLGTSYTFSLPNNSGSSGQILTNMGGGMTTWQNAPADSNPQSANMVLAGPTSGGPVMPTFRSLAAADLPATYRTTGGTGLSLGTTDGNPINLGTNNSVTMSILSTGSVGIGTLAPLGVFAVSGPSGAPAVSGGYDPALIHRVQSFTNAIDMGVDDPWGAGWIQTRNALINGSLANLNINPLGGTVQIGSFTAPTNSNELTVAQNGTANAIVATGSTGNLLSLQGITPSVFTANGQVGLGTTNPTTTLDVNGAVSVRGMSAPATAPVSQGRIYFDSTSNQFMVSQNGGAYATLATTSGGALNLNSNDITGLGPTLTGNGSLIVGAGGTNQNLTLSGSGTGNVNIEPAGGSVGIGTATPMATLDVEVPPFLGTSSNGMGAVFNGAWNPSGTPSAGSSFATGLFQASTPGNGTNFAASNVMLQGLNAQANHNGTGTLSMLVGAYAGASNMSSGAVTQAYGVMSEMQNNGNGSINTGAGFSTFFNPNGTSGTYINAIGLDVNFGAGSGTIVNGYGVKIENVSSNVSSTNYGVYVGTMNGPNKFNYYASDASSVGYFAGSVGIGTTSPGGNLLNVNGPVKLGSTGTQIMNMGTCTISSTTWTTAVMSGQICTGLPSPSALVFCSPTTQNTGQTFSVLATAANTVSVVASTSGSTALNCFFVTP